MQQLPNVPGVMKIIFEFQTNTGTTALPMGGFSLFYSFSGALSVPNANTLATQASGAWSNDMKVLQSTTQQLASVQVIDLTTKSSAAGMNTTVIAGTRAGQELPIDCCTLVNYKIARRYRGGKPRTYLPCGIAGDILDGRHWTVGYSASFEAGFTQFLLDIKAINVGQGTMGQVNVGYFHGFTSVQDPLTKRWRNVPTLASPTNVDPIVSQTMNPVVGSQRRRLRTPG